MSLDALIWAVKDAPLADPFEHAVLTVLAEEAGEDGCAAFPSVPTIAERAHMSPREVRKCLAGLVDRRLIDYGDQSLAAYIRADRRPTVYDLLIPATWFGNLDRVNRWRATKERPPLDGDACMCPRRSAASTGQHCSHRPPIAPAPARKRRADLGTRRGVTAIHAVPSDGVTATPPVHGVTSSPPGLQGRHGVTSKSSDGDLSQQVSADVPPPRGDYQTPDPLTQRTNPSTPLPPTGAAAGAAESPTEDEHPAGELVARALVIAPHWSRTKLERVLADPDMRDRLARAQDATASAVLAVAAGKYGRTASPRRLLEDGPWWADAHGVALEPDAPALPAQRCPANCIRGKIMVEVVVDGFPTGKDRPQPCPHCSATVAA